MDWGVGGREFAGGVSDRGRLAMARITAETQRAQKKTTTGLRQRHRETEKQEKLKTEGRQKSGHSRSGRDSCLRRAGFDRLEAKAPASLCKTTQGRQDDDVRRIVRNANWGIRARRDVRQAKCEDPARCRRCAGYSWVSSCSAWADGFAGRLMGSPGGVRSGAARRYWTGQLTGKPRSRATARGQ